VFVLEFIEMMHSYAHLK